MLNSYMRPESAILSCFADWCGNAVSMCQEMIWQPVHLSGVLMFGAQGLRLAKFRPNLTIGRFKSKSFMLTGKCTGTHIGEKVFDNQSAPHVEARKG